MFSRFTDNGKKTTVALVAMTVLAMVLAYGLPRVHAVEQQASGQAPATSRGRGARRGGGFTHPTPINYNDHNGWVQLFNGKNLDGWEGNTSVWHVEDGAIVGESSDAHPSGTTNIFYTRLQPANFMLAVQFKIEGTGANGGIQYRSKNEARRRTPPSAEQLAQMTPEQRQQMQQRQAAAQKNAKWAMMGYQADMDYNNRYTGQVYEQGTGRGIIAWPGDIVFAQKGEKPMLLGTSATPDQIKSYVKVGDWNQFLIIANGSTMTHLINGHVTAVLVDKDPTYAASKGLIGFEIEGRGTLKISYRDIWLKNLP